MHANVQTRFNPAAGDMAPYYRIKESYRDVQGHIKEHLDGLTLIEQAKADEWWSRMEKEGVIPI